MTKTPSSTSSKYSITESKSHPHEQSDARKLSFDGIKHAFTRTFRRNSVAHENKNSRTKSEKHHAMETGSKDRKFDIFFRLGTNCSEILIVGILLVVHITLTLTGLWNRQTTTGLPVNKEEWSTIGNSCLLTPNGFISCSTNETSLVSDVAWTAIGSTLASRISQVFAGKSFALVMTTCAYGLERGYGTIVFLLSEHWSPFCVTDTPEKISAIAILETARNESNNVNYLLSTYADSATEATTTRRDTDGTKTQVMSNLAKVLISNTGQVVPVAPEFANWRYESYPVWLKRYQFTYSCYSEIIQDNALAHHFGEASGKGLLIGRTCSHIVTNYHEITTIQYISVFGMCHLFGGDIFTTLKGLQGVLLRRPVLTYDFLSGLERRKIIMFFLIFVRLGGLFYLEVVRVYNQTPIQRGLFYIVCAMASGLFTLVIFWFMVILQHLPSLPFCKNRAIRVFAPFMHLGTFFFSFVIIGSANISEIFYKPLWQRPQTTLAFNINNKTLGTGAYDDVIVTPCIRELIPLLAIASSTMITVGIIYPMVKHRQIFLDMNFFQRNDFLTHQFVPSYITCLPMYESECIRYGNKLFLKASTVALMGYGIIEEDHGSVIEVKPAGTKHEDPPFTVVSLYDLLPCLLPHKLYAPPIVCTVQNYQYQAVPTGTKLRKTTRYFINKGTCIS